MLINENIKRNSERYKDGRNLLSKWQMALRQRLFLSFDWPLADPQSLWTKEACQLLFVIGTKFVATWL